MALSEIVRGDPAIMAWLAYASHVDEKHKLLYVETPKAGCATIKILLRALITQRVMVFNPRVPATRMEMFIHDHCQLLRDVRPPLANRRRRNLGMGL